MLYHFEISIIYYVLENFIFKISSFIIIQLVLLNQSKIIDTYTWDQIQSLEVLSIRYKIPHAECSLIHNDEQWIESRLRYFSARFKYRIENFQLDSFKIKWIFIRYFLLKFTASLTPSTNFSPISTDFSLNSPHFDATASPASLTSSFKDSVTCQALSLAPSNLSSTVFAASWAKEEI